MDDPIAVTSAVVCVLSLIISVVEQNRKYKEMSNLMMQREQDRGDVKRRESEESARHSAYIERDLQHISRMVDETRHELKQLSLKFDNLHENVVALSTKQDQLQSKVSHNQNRVDDLEQVMRNEAILGTHNKKSSE